MEGITVRAARVDDYLDAYDVAASPGVYRDTLQLPYVSVDRRRKFIEDLSPDDHLLVAEVEGRVVGTLGLHRQKARRAHVAQIGMGVHDDFQGKGAGTALMEAALDTADNWLNLKRVELTVFTDNARAVHLYEKFGFVTEGTHRDYAFRDGEYVDAYFMARVKE